MRSMHICRRKISIALIIFTSYCVSSLGAEGVKGNDLRVPESNNLANGSFSLTTTDVRPLYLDLNTTTMESVVDVQATVGDMVDIPVKEQKEKLKELSEQKEHVPELVQPKIVKPININVHHSGDMRYDNIKFHSSQTLIVLMIFLVACYIGIHNKHKIIGLIVEGRSGRHQGRRAMGVRYRPLNTDESALESGIY